jgi:hypothetical protein
LQTFANICNSSVCELLGKTFELSGLHIDIVNLSDTIRIFQVGFEHNSSHLQVMLRCTMKLVVNPKHRSRKISKGTSTITFRIEKDVLNTLRTQSVQEDISLNTFINQILKRYVGWGMFEPGFMIPLARSVVAKIFGKMSRDEILDLAKNVAKKAVQDMILFTKGKIDLDSFLSWFELRMKSAFIEIHRYLLWNLITG